jgi:alpha-mannosidase
MRTPLLSIFAFVSFCFITAGAAETNRPPDLSRERVLYEIGYSHLDTQWRWSYPQVIREFIPNTVRSNVMLLEKYPDYIFNWTGANRYRLMQEYHPEDFEMVREWVGKGRWFPAGSSWEENDPNIPSSESQIRQLLFGQRFFKREFNIESCEFFLPDSFGFPASLPSVLAHCGLRGFSTQKLTWNSVVGIPFDVGVWEGPDGNSVIAALNAGNYVTSVRENLSTSQHWLKRLNEIGHRDGIFADYWYYGVGDRGGAPDEESVQWIEKSVASTGAVRVISAKADQMFNDITDSQKARLPKYKGDLLLTKHSAGSMTSEAYMKRWNHENELLANAAETAAVSAHVLGTALYPREKLQHAWELVLANQFHDTLPGTCLPKAYEYAWNDEIIALNSFAEVLQDSVGAVARDLDTRGEGIPMVILNPLSITREDVVEAELQFPMLTTNVQVFDGDDRPVPTQVLSINGGKTHFLFLAKAPSLGFAVFSAKASSASTPDSSLKVNERSLENGHYCVTINDAGDIAQIYDKVAGQNLLAAPARLAFLTENPQKTPAWDMEWQDQTNVPRGYVSGPAKIRVVENGPVRIAVEVERKSENSDFIQTIRLAAGEAGDRVEVENNVDWQAKACALKAVFPLSISNPLATYNWDLGKVTRPTDYPKEYEVPTHQWFDLTDDKSGYGVSILCPKKYGSDKPSDNTVRLTLLYTPNSTGGYAEQRSQDWGRQEFIYGIYGHKGDWRQGKSDWRAARLDQPMRAFQTATHPGKLGRHFSLLKVNSDDIAIRAVKLAEDDNQVIVRLQELNGTGTKPVNFDVSTGIGKATEVTGFEKSLHPLNVRRDGLKLDFKPYQLRSLALTPVLPNELSLPVSTPVPLPYDLDAFSFRGAKQDGDFDDGASYPAEMINDTVVSEGVKFQIGSRANGQNNAVSCRGQVINLPAGQFNRLYLLAAAAHGDTGGDFVVDGRPIPLRVQNWTGYIGQWDNRVFEGQVPELNYGFTNALKAITPGFIKRDPLAWFCSHRHLPDGSDAIYSYCYLFKHRLDLPAGARTLRLPDNPNIRIFAASLAQDNNDATVPAWPLYDDFTGRKPVELHDPTFPPVTVDVFN